METLPFFAFGPPSGFHSGLIFRMTHGPASVICPLGVRVWFFTMFHVPVVELYFPIMAWFDIKSIFKLIKFSLYGVFQFFMFPLSNPPPHTMAWAWSLTLDPLSAFHLGFPWLCYTCSSFSFLDGKCSLCSTFLLTT